MSLAMASVAQESRLITGHGMAHGVIVALVT